MEEERRLAYVAFTRAKFELCLTESETSGREDGYKKYPSRFIFNIDRSLLDVEGELDEEFVRNYGYSVDPKAYNLSRRNIMYGLSDDLGFDWGETKLLIDWLFQYFEMDNL